MKCKYCDGTGTSNWCVNGTFKPCEYCNGKGEVENLCDTCGTICPFDDEHSECEFYTPQTNEEWLKSTKDTNQFACEMCELFEILCTDCKFYDKSMRIGGCTLPSWLKEVHNDG